MRTIAHALYSLTWEQNCVKTCNLMSATIAPTATGTTAAATGAATTGASGATTGSPSQCLTISRATPANRNRIRNWNRWFFRLRYWISSHSIEDGERRGEPSNWRFYFGRCGSIYDPFCSISLEFHTGSKVETLFTFKSRRLCYGSVA
jgi:hypothetical protein